VTVTVNRFAGTLGGIQVQYATDDDEALFANDYGETTGTLTFGVNELSKTFQIPIVDDPWDEASFEEFVVRLTQVSAGSIGSPSTQVLRILDNADTGIFGDGFEHRDTDAWSDTQP
jgi:hypothetical protein